MSSGTGDTWECNNGDCITPASWECDGFVDCSDGSDEDEHCPGGCKSRMTTFVKALLAMIILTYSLLTTYQMQ